MDFSALLTPFQLKSLQLRNRVAMAPMTRGMSPGHIPGDDVAAYYVRRASGGVGLIITEGAVIGHPSATGYPDVPLMAGENPLAGWKCVVDGVHADEIRIFSPESLNALN
jgi:2,4-dienoyl-CoA reductase-like NADH-dependent reductase (Old Yellow Enzyme family)